MSKKKLLEKLNKGEITQEYFDDLTAKLGDLIVDDTTDTESENTQAGERKDDKKAPVDTADIEQRAYDKAANKFGNTIKQLQEELNNLKTANMNEEQKNAFNFEQQKKSLAEREAALNEKECRLQAISALNKRGINDLSIVEVVMGKDPETTVQNVDRFVNAYNKAVQSQVQATFKANGTEPSGIAGGQQKEENNEDKPSKAVELAKNLAKPTGQNSADIINAYLGGDK